MSNATKPRIICLSICLALFTFVFFVSAEAAVVVVNPLEEVDQLMHMC
ncbi:MAG: hypothetical protein P1Q69_03400 [Candidatus Thorarchaeota archaeon]|nr:hypothetical protein [Candidatus Thorarchaeota archaeon]